MKSYPRLKIFLFIAFTLASTTNCTTLFSQNVGIGTQNPTAKLHTLGTVRFEGLDSSNNLKRIGVLDSLGNLFWKNQDSLLVGTWALKGNAINVGQFLGTTNNQRLVFKTNNVEQATILPNGNVGIGFLNPDRKLYIYNSLTGFNDEVVIKQGPGSLLGSYLVLDNTANNGGRYWAVGSSGYLNTSGQLGAVGSLEFYQFDAGPTERVRMIITPEGNVGIHTIPSARFHVNGSVKFDNLPSGVGQALVIGADGQLYKSSAILNSAESGSLLQSQIDDLNIQITALKAEIAKLQAQLNLQ